MERLDEECLPLEGFSFRCEPRNYLRLGEPRSGSGRPGAAASPDLAGRIDSLEKQLADLKSQMEAQKAAAAAPVPAQAAVATTAPPLLLRSRTHRTCRPAGANHVERIRRCLLRLQLKPARRPHHGVSQLRHQLRPVRTEHDRTGGRQGAGCDCQPRRLSRRSGLRTGDEHQSISTEPGQFATESNFDQYLKEGYLEYLAPVGKGLQINVGKFVTPAGAEVIETKDNWNYSRGLLFALAIPYFHFGASAQVCVQPQVCA